MNWFYLLFLVAAVSSVKVDLSGEWTPGYGGKVNCSWAFPRDDRLQSVKLYFEDQELMVFRPEIREWHIESAITKHEFTIDCRNIIDYTRTDSACVIIMNPVRPPPLRGVFACEVSGERPYFRVVRKTHIYEPFVPASSPELDAHEVFSPGSAKLNCSSAGLPAPELEWGVGGRKVSADFSGLKWDSTSSTWRVWSSITLSNLHSDLDVTCTPKQKGLLEKEVTVAKFRPVNTAQRIKGVIINVGVFALTLMLR